ncbi:MAG: GTP cyclohydrolase, FolE2/MptA family [Desulfobulbus sp.]|nr:GTP cyclohydrolase, FolE2/MptA family [Desulfobulbus sp.]
MKDIQSSADSRRIDIRKVGVKTITYPITVLDKANRTQSTIATVNMYVNLPHHFKGTHMSRFVEILNRFHGAFNLKTFRLILEEMKLRLDAEAAHLEMDFPYFFQGKTLPEPLSLCRYDCRLHGSLATRFDLQVEVDVPLSREQIGSLSDSGLAGLWGMVTVAVRMKSFLWIEDLIALVEGAVQSRHWEKETVESLCLQINDVLMASQAFQWYKVVVKNSANGYSAFAVSQWTEQSAEQ